MRVVARVLAAVYLCAIAVPADAAATFEISWRVDNGMRFLKRPSDFQAIRKVYDSLKSTANPRPTALQLELALQAAWQDESLGIEPAAPGTRRFGWASAVVGHTCGNELDQPDPDSFRDGYKSCAMSDGQSYIEPKSVAGTAQLVVLDPKLSLDEQASCVWKLGDGEPVTQACSKPYPFRVDYNVTIPLQVSVQQAPPVTTTIEIEDKLIVGFGDSFASGEGNPERPVALKVALPYIYDGGGGIASSTDGHGHARYYPARARVSNRPGDPAFFNAELAARWSNTQCHRSIYSQHFKAALHYALEHPDRTVTLLHYACTGAAVNEGILNAWRGRFDRRDGSPDGFRRDDAPQIVKLWRDLCKASHAEWDRVDWGTNDDELDGGAAQVPDCKGALKRPIDVLLVSIGGNDVGFASMVAGAFLGPGIGDRRKGSIFNNRSQIYGLWKAAASPQDFPTGKSLVAKRLPGLYSALATALDGLSDSAQPLARQRVVLTAYPDLARDETGGLCRNGNRGMEVHDIFRTLRSQVTKASDFIGFFHTHLRTYANNRKWALADEHFVTGQPNSFQKDDKGVGHGLCAARPGVSAAQDELAFPTPPYPVNFGSNPVWSPKDADFWWPFTPLKNRWVVTPNDAFMAGNFHDNNLPVDDPVQPLFAATLSGSFHLNDLGHAAVADSVLAEIRKSPMAKAPEAPSK